MEVHGLEENVAESVKASEIVQRFLLGHQEAIELLSLHEFQCPVPSLLELGFGEVESFLEGLSFLHGGHCVRLEMGREFSFDLLAAKKSSEQEPPFIIWRNSGDWNTVASHLSVGTKYRSESYMHMYCYYCSVSAILNSPRRYRLHRLVFPYVKIPPMLVGAKIVIDRSTSVDPCGVKKPVRDTRYG